VPLNLIKNLNVPILGPSANFSNGTTPFKFKDLDKRLVKLVDFVLEGKTKYNNSSTVVDCTKSPWHIIRQGEVLLDI
jgi:tRNA A37 threonylcarbamoyladenosine synthetase subunit TsaC/SUA5/YrdC